MNVVGSAAPEVCRAGDREGTGIKAQIHPQATECPHLSVYRESDKEAQRRVRVTAGGLVAPLWLKREGRSITLAPGTRGQASHP